MDNVPAPAPGPCWSSPCWSSPCCHPDKSCSGWASRARGAGWGRAQPCQSCRTRRNLAPQKCRAQDLACVTALGRDKAVAQSTGGALDKQAATEPSRASAPRKNVPNSGAKCPQLRGSGAARSLCPVPKSDTSRACSYSTAALHGNYRQNYRQNYRKTIDKTIYRASHRTIDKISTELSTEL